MEANNISNGYKVKLAMDEQSVRYLACLSIPGKNPRKFTRFQAFADLIGRFYTASLKEFNDGIPVSELAPVWGWSNPTTSNFIRKLEKLDLVTTAKIGNCNFVAPKPQNFVLTAKHPLADRLPVENENNASGA